MGATGQPRATAWVFSTSRKFLFCQALGLAFRALKGTHRTAQGNALGTEEEKPILPPALEGRQKPWFPMRWCRPDRAKRLIFECPVAPRALPWTVLWGPFRAADRNLWRTTRAL